MYDYMKGKAIFHQCWLRRSNPSSVVTCFSVGNFELQMLGTPMLLKHSQSQPHVPYELFFVLQLKSGVQPSMPSITLTMHMSAERPIIATMWCFTKAESTQHTPNRVLSPRDRYQLPGPNQIRNCVTESAQLVLCH
jgi:hypothetical protein